MGAGFGHTYAINNNHYAALAFSHGDGDIFELAEESANEANKDILNPDDYYTLESETDGVCEYLSDCLEALKSIAVTFKGRTFDVKLNVESTYNGDDLCLVPSNLWDAYSEVIENSTRAYNVIDWQAVAEYEDELQIAFELALCKEVFKQYPWMYVRPRVWGWCGTSYKPVSSYIDEFDWIHVG